MKVGLPLTENELTILAKNILMPLGLAAATPATDAAIQKTIHGSRIHGTCRQVNRYIAASLLGNILSGKGII